MGMAASQARFLGLTARKTNIEFEGQQINQQRTTLSNESASYYSKLTNLSVPTPPSTQDYSKITYTFTDGSETNTINQLIATRTTTGEKGYYIVNYTQSVKTESILSNGTVIVNRIKGAGATTDDPKYGYYLGSSQLRGLYTAIPTSPTIEGSTEVDYSEIGKNDEYLSTLSADERKNAIALEVQYASILKEKYKEDDWFVRYQKDTTTGTYNPVFFSQKQIENADYNDKTGTSLSMIKSYSWGETVEAHEIKNAKARTEQDSSGRYINITIYDTDKAGNILKGTDGQPIGRTYPLTSTTSTDDNAYNDAMNQYSYDKALYDQEIQKINAKIEIIQGQDKNLELKLKQLDTERNAIVQEMDAIQKVISKNVNDTFKVFQG